MNIQNEKGVSVIMLIIAIAMMAIIVSFAVFYSKDTTPEAKLASAYSSLKTIKEACDNAQMLIELNPAEYDEYYFFGNNLQYKITNSSELSNLITKCGLTSIDDLSERTYIIKPEDGEEEKRVLENLELKGVTNTYIVDLENKKYYLVGGAKRVDSLGNSSGDESVYEYKDVIEAYEMLID